VAVPSTKHTEKTKSPLQSRDFREGLFTLGQISLLRGCLSIVSLSGVHQAHVQVNYLGAQLVLRDYRACPRRTKLGRQF
jgi:hypothetical protein